jgi:hypothetical protein
MGTPQLAYLIAEEEITGEADCVLVVAYDENVETADAA